MITSPVPTQASPSLPRLAPSYISPQPVSTLISSTFSSSSSLSASSSISITPTALSNLNAILDRILFLVLSSAQSLDPRDLREAGVGTVFRWEGEGEGDKMQKLGLEAIKEAEIELTVWRDKARITSTSTSTPEAKSSSAAVAPASEPAAPSTSISSTRASSPSLENAKGSSPLQEWSNAARVKNNGRVGGQVEVPERDQKPFDKYKKGLRRHSKNQNQNQSQSHSPGNAIGTRIDTATKDGIVKEGCPGSTQFEFPIKEAFEMVRIRVMNYCVSCSCFSPSFLFFFFLPLILGSDFPYYFILFHFILAFIYFIFRLGFLESDLMRFLILAPFSSPDANANTDPLQPFSRPKPHSPIHSSLVPRWRKSKRRHHRTCSFILDCDYRVHRRTYTRECCKDRGEGCGSGDCSSGTDDQTGEGAATVEGTGTGT